MVNNKGKILVCLFLLLVVSIGYALFSENLNVSGKAHATGNFSYEVGECIPGSRPEYNIENYRGNVETATCKVENNNIIISSIFRVPGEQYVYTVKVTNTGTIPIQFDPENLLYGITGKLCADGFYKQSGQYGPDFIYKPGSNDGKITPDECISSDEYTSWGTFIYLMAHGSIGGNVAAGFDSNYKRLDKVTVLNKNDYIYIVIRGLFEPQEKQNMENFLYTSESITKIPMVQVTN